jgi:hypothetical protein
MIVPISEDLIDKAIEFADKSVESNKDRYARRNQTDVDKIIQDIRVGKIGEEIVYNHLISKIPNLSKPDYNIYDKFNKSWDSDLKDGDSSIKIGVKSQNIFSANLYGVSWVFQFNNNKNFDCDKEVFKEESDNNFIAFVSLNIPKRNAEVRGIVKTQFLHDNKLFKDMKKEQLKGNKVAVYWEDLEKLDNLFQL